MGLRRIAPVIAVILGFIAALLTNDQLHDCEREKALIQAACPLVESLAEKWSISAGVGFFVIMLVEVAVLFYERILNAVDLARPVKKADSDKSKADARIAELRIKLAEQRAETARMQGQLKAKVEAERRRADAELAEQRAETARMQGQLEAEVERRRADAAEHKLELERVKRDRDG